MNKKALVVKFMHANLKNEDTSPREIYVSVPQVFSWYFSEANKCTHIVATGGAIMPVLESPAQIAQTLQGN